METVVDQDVVVDGVRIAYRDGEGVPRTTGRARPRYTFALIHLAS